MWVVNSAPTELCLRQTTHPKTSYNEADRLYVKEGPCKRWQKFLILPSTLLLTVGLHLFPSLYFIFTIF
jgi:hypothetical protein